MFIKYIFVEIYEVCIAFGSMLGKKSITRENDILDGLFDVQEEDKTTFLFMRKGRNGGIILHGVEYFVTDPKLQVLTSINKFKQALTSINKY